MATAAKYGSVDDEEKLEAGEAKSTAIQDEDDPSEFQDLVAKMAKWSYVFIPLFCLIVIAVIIFLPLGLVVFSAWNVIFIILAFNIGGAVGGAVGVRKFGSVSEQIERFKQENNKYSASLDVMGKNVDTLKDEVRAIHAVNDGLNKGVHELQDSLGRFDDLRKDLENLAQKDAHIFEMINSIAGTMDHMHDLARKNEKAALLQQYYKARFLDPDPDMSEREYKRFLGYLSHDTRGEWEKLYSFDAIAGADGEIDMDEFEKAIDNFCEVLEDKLIAKSMK